MGLPASGVGPSSFPQPQPKMIAWAFGRHSSPSPITVVVSVTPLPEADGSGIWYNTVSLLHHILATAFTEGLLDLESVTVQTPKPP